MARELITLASEEPSIMISAGVIGGFIVSTIGFLIHRAINRGDKQRDDEKSQIQSLVTQINTLLKDLGKLEMKLDASWRNIDDLKSDFKDLRDKLYEVKK